MEIKLGILLHQNHNAGHCSCGSRGFFSNDEFTSKVLDEWAYRRGIKIDYTRPGKPTDSGLIELFNGRLRDEFLKVNEFVTLYDTREKLKFWQYDYNHLRPHGSLGNLTPSEFVDSRSVQPDEAASLQFRTVQFPGSVTPNPIAGSFSSVLFAVFTSAELMILQNGNPRFHVGADLTDRVGADKTEQEVWMYLQRLISG